MFWAFVSLSCKPRSWNKDCPVHFRYGHWGWALHYRCYLKGAQLGEMRMSLHFFCHLSLWSTSTSVCTRSQKKNRLELPKNCPFNIYSLSGASTIYYFSYGCCLLSPQFICLLPSVYPSHHLIDSENLRVSSPRRQFHLLALNSK